MGSIGTGASRFLLILFGMSLFVSVPIFRADYAAYNLQSSLPGVSAQSQSNEPIYTIQKSDNSSLDFTVQLRGLQIWNQTVGQITFQRIRIPGPTPTGQGLLSDLGLPELPTLTKIIAVPFGSNPVVAVRDTSNPSTMTNVLVYPAQIGHRNRAGVNDPEPPFQQNSTFYGQFRDSYPTIFSNQSTVERLRDVEVIILTLFPVRWNPSTNTLSVHDQFDVTVNFRGGAGYFIGARSKNAHENSFQQLYTNTILNAENIGRYIGPLIPSTKTSGPCSEYVIITPPAFKSAANTLAAWKNSKGITTFVVDTTTTGSTDSAIRSYIQGLYTDCDAPPSYVLLLGDVDYIPTHYYDECSDCPTKNGGDLYYSTFVGSDSLPDLSIGRFTVDTLSQAQTVVNKTVNYEQNPPTLASFYRTMVFASYFQDDNLNGQDVRAFVQTSEAIRNSYTASYTVQRIYTAPGASNPMRYADGTPIPAALQRPGFAWSGSTADITAAINAGAFLVFHRDHGWWDGWGSPGYGLSQVDALTNGNLLPVVFSINCASGIFDQKTVDPGYGATSTAVYFGERMLRKANGGAVAVIGDMRSSDSNANNDLSYGLFNGMALARIFGPVRVGNLLTFAKLWLSLRGWAGAGLLKEVEIYNLLGDPTLEIWLSQPASPSPAFSAFFSVLLALSVATLAKPLRKRIRRK